MNFILFEWVTSDTHCDLTVWHGNFKFGHNRDESPYFNVYLPLCEKNRYKGVKIVIITDVPKSQIPRLTLVKKIFVSLFFSSLL